MQGSERTSALRLRGGQSPSNQRARISDLGHSTLLTWHPQSVRVHVPKHSNLVRSLVIEEVPHVGRIGIKAQAFADMILVNHITELDIFGGDGAVVAKPEWPVSIGPPSRPPDTWAKAR